MGKTIAEKILSSHAERSLKAGDFAICNVDFAFAQDGTSAIVIDRIKELGIKQLKTKFSMVIDHSAPSPSEGVSRVHKKMRSFAKEFDASLYDVGCGVCHQVILESGQIWPHSLVLGADSHTCTYGALAAFSTGVGSTDLAIALATGKNWFKVPETIKIIVTGRPARNIFAKDIILRIIKEIKADGATYKAVEFAGGVIDKMAMDDRFTICNMAVEMGAKAAFMPFDKKTFDYIKSKLASCQLPAARKRLKDLNSDKDAKYENIFEFDISKLRPQIACPHTVDNVVSIDELKNVYPARDIINSSSNSAVSDRVRIDEAFLGTCTNGRLNDLKVAASILKARKVASGVKFIIAPASGAIFLNALKLGLIDIFIKAGAVVLSPGCGPCVGTHNGIPADDEVVISSANRNFKGRMGNPNAFIYLASPATVAASALKGYIADPGEFLGRLAG